MTITAALRILATTDVHMHLTGWDLMREVDVPDRGLARLATRIAEAREDASGAVIVVDNGDSLQGTPLADHLQKRETVLDHPWVAAMNAIRYDAIGLGNHDFDFGLDYLSALAAACDAPVVCSNISPSPKIIVQTIESELILPCSDGVSRALKVGIVSFTPPETKNWNKGKLADHIDFLSPEEMLGPLTAQLRANGCDLVLALAHSGFAESETSGQKEFFADKLAKSGLLDAMIAGHAHHHFPTFSDAAANGLIHGVPCVMPGYAADVLGQIDLSLTWDGHWCVTDACATLLPAQGATESETIVAAVRPALDETDQSLQSIVGSLGQPIHSYFALVQPDAASGLVAEAMVDVVVEAYGEDVPVLAAVAPQTCGGLGGPQNYVDVGTGPITERDSARLCPYPNEICAVPMSGADLREWIERSLAIFPESKPGGALHDKAAFAFNFETISELDVQCDTTLPRRYDLAGELVRPDIYRTSDLRLRGKGVRDSDRFLLAMSGFRAGGAGGFPGLDCPDAHLRTGVRVQDALRDLLKRHEDWRPRLMPRWRLAPPVGLDAIFETGPGAANYLDEIARFSPTVDNETSDGFLRIKLRL